MEICLKRSAIHNPSKLIQKESSSINRNKNKHFQMYYMMIIIIEGAFFYSTIIHPCNYTISREPGMYRDSLHIFDSPQLCLRLWHCSHRWYLSHCSWSRTPGVCVRSWYSSSRVCLSEAAFFQSSSSDLRVPTWSS